MGYERSQLPDWPLGCEPDSVTMSKKWIARAIKHHGALHRQLGVPEGQKIPASKLNAAAEKGGTLGRRANLAKTLSRLRHSK